MSVATTANPDATTNTAWSRFVGAGTSDAFCRAWLDLVCPDTSAWIGAVLIESDTGDNFVPMAVWPEAGEELARLGPAVNKAIEERRGLVEPVEGHPERVHAVLPLIISDHVRGAVVVETAAANASNAMHKLHWGSAWLVDLLSKREMESATLARRRATGVLESLATSLRHRKFQQALFDLVNDLRERLDCSRAAVGLVRHKRVKVVALSEAATFEKSSPLIIAYHDAMCETVDLAQTIHVSTSSDTPGESLRAHAALMQRTGADTTISIPVTHQVEPVAVVTLERNNGPAFTADERDWLDLMTSFLAPVVVQRRAAERSSPGRLREEVRRFLAAVMGPRHLIWKSVGVLMAITVALLVFVHIDYRVTATAVVEGRMQRVIAAPFDGYISASFVRAGDVVHKGEVLAKLNDHNLRIKHNKWASERNEDSNRLRQAMAGRDLSTIRVAHAKLQEAQAQLDLVNNRLEHASIRAPFDGVIISGDLSQQIGSPVKTGKQLFQIAPLNSYRIILKVDERNIRDIEQGEHGKLVMTGRPDAPMSFVVVKVTPVAVTKDGHNYFRVEAHLVDSNRQLLPGMQGVGKISIGQRRLGWILFHPMADWFRLKTWSWSP